MRRIIGGRDQWDLRLALFPRVEESDYREFTKSAVGEIFPLVHRVIVLNSLAHGVSLVEEPPNWQKEMK